MFYKRCFTSFDDRTRKYRKDGQAGLEAHLKICGAHKAILPMMPAKETLLDFKSLGNTVRHPIVIYADFEALLVKSDERRGDNTVIIQKHNAMSYGFVVKASEDVPLELLEEYDIPLSPIIYRGSEEAQDVARHFVEAIVEVGRKVEKLLKTNKTIIMSETEEKLFKKCKKCNLCKCYLAEHDKVRDHCHLSGKFRQTLCFKCNLTL
jgi:hypothetical protein